MIGSKERPLSSREKKELAVWQAFAAGDAMGMPTEFMTIDEIRAVVPGLPEDLLPSRLSKKHPNLPEGSVTDDTEQNLYLLSEARNAGRLTPNVAADALKKWIRETGAAEKKYIGPSSLRALASLEEGVSFEKAGLGGTTCGGIMRTPAAVLWDPEQSESRLADSIHSALLPTHNTSEALEAAGAYGFALRAALLGEDLDGIFEAALRGGRTLIRRAPEIACAPSSTERIRAARSLSLSESDLASFLFHVWGTGLPSADVCGAVFAVFFHAGKDAWKAVRLSSVLGGDTDTIGALSGALSAAYAGESSIPPSVLSRVLSVNESLFREKLPFLL